jgi:predicted GNAT family acetyltransferase
VDVRDNKERHRFEMDTEGGVAFATYREENGVVFVLHTEVPSAVEGRGLGGKLVRGLLDRIRADKKKVVPRCDFVAAFICGHGEYQDLLV